MCSFVVSRPKPWSDVIQRVPVSVHLDLYRYWDAKRGTRPMPARGEIDPTDMVPLLPHLTIVEALGAGEYRYRLVGTRVVADLGRDVTGQLVGALVSPPAYAASLKALYTPVCTELIPLFVTGAYRGRNRVVHAISRLLLPLGEGQGPANMVLLSRVTRHSANVRVPADWLGQGVGSTERVDRVETLAALERLVVDWECRCAL